MPRSSRPPPRKQPHTLVEPRLVAAVGLVALGGGIGIALMLAHTLVLLGLVISLAAAGGVLWIYFAHIVEVYKALSKNTIYRGPSIKEISVALAMVIVLVPLAIDLYLSRARPDNLARARLQYDRAFPVKDPRTSAQWVNFELKNSGTLAAKRAVVGAIGKLSSASFAVEAAKKEMDDLRAKVVETVPPAENTVLPDHSAIITFPNLSITDADIDAINQGKSALNVFVVATYEDEAFEGEGYWITEFCGYYILTLSYWHNCTLVPERVYRVQGSRPEH
jgi:hypothetical protein